MPTLLRPALIFFTSILHCTLAHSADKTIGGKLDRESSNYGDDLKPASNTTEMAWRLCYSTHFIVCGPSWFDGDAAARKCEAHSRQLSEQWLGDSALHWKTRCYVVFHPTVGSYVRSAGQGADATAGCTTVKKQGGQVLDRRIDIRLDRSDPLHGALRHELTHAVLADAVARYSLPKWADEGMATLADSAEKRLGHQHDLVSAVADGKGVRLSEFLALADYPPLSRRLYFYGQGLSLVSFLVERESPQQFLQFVETATVIGYDTAIREHYGFNGVDGLERAWRRKLIAGDGLSGNADGTRAPVSVAAHQAQPLP